MWQLAISQCYRKEVEEQVINLVGTNDYYGLQVVPVQQQNNGSDCRVFATAFCHMSDLWDSTTNSTIWHSTYANTSFKVLKIRGNGIFPTF